LIALVVAEFAIRVIDPFELSSLEDSARYHLDKVPDPVLVYKHRSNFQATYQGVPMTTNEHGWRDRPLQAKAVGELRVLILGDSIAFGPGVPVEDIFATRLEDKLAKDLGRPVRTVNTGVGSYNTAVQSALLKTYFDRIAPDIVILMYVSNDLMQNLPPFDPWSKRSLSGKSPPETVNLLLGRSWLFRLYELTLEIYGDRAPLYDMRTVGARESMAALADIAAFCRSHDVPFVTFVYRTHSELTSAASTNYLGEIAKVGESNGFPVVDVAPWWTGMDMRSVINSLTDVHPNAKGHEILANRIAATLTESGLVTRAPSK
jgi:lysophospholipase L1-like esterase